MSRIQPFIGSLPRHAPTPVAGGSPQSIQAAFNRNYKTTDEINRAIGQATEAGYGALAADLRSSEDLLGAGFTNLAATARQRASELRDRTLGTGVDPNTGIPTGHLGIMQQGFDWLQGSNRARAAGYKQLYDDAMEDVRSLGATERMDLEERYRRAAADSDMSLARRGLGNSTVRGAARRGIDFDRARASTALTDTLTRERLGVRGQFGMAEQQFLERAGERNREQQNMIARARADADTGISQFGTSGELGAYGQSLAAQERGIGRNTDLGLSQLGWMNSIQAPYPNAGQYAALAQAAGQAGVDPFGGGGGAAGGGHTVTRGGPWAGDKLMGSSGFAMNDPGLAYATGAVPMFVDNGRGQMVSSRYLQGTNPHQYQTIAEQAVAPEAIAPSANPFGAGQRQTTGGAGMVAPSGGGLQSGGGASFGSGFGGGFGSTGEVAPGGYVVPESGAGYYGGGAQYELSPEELYGLTGEQYELSPEEIAGLVGE